MSLKRLFREADRDMVVLFLGAGVLLTLVLNYGRPLFASRVLGTRPDAPAALTFYFGSVFLCFGVAPALLWRFALKRPLLLMGLAPGDFRFGLRLVALALPLVVLPVSFLSSWVPELRAEYPLASGAGATVGGFLLYEAAYLLYYVGYETTFRGFLLFGLERRMGAFPAVGVTTLVTTAFHLGKPEGEVWGALAVGVLFGWFALRTRSFLYPLVVHATVGVLLDVLIVFGPGSLRP